MSPYFVTSLIGIIIAVMTLGQVSPSATSAIFAKNVEIGLSRESSLMQQIVRYKAVEGVYPAIVNDLVAKGYWKASENNNQFGGTYTFTIDSIRNQVAISTTIADATRRAQYLGNYRHIFKPVDMGSGVVTSTFIIPKSNYIGALTPTASSITVAATAPDAATNKYWYDTSGQIPVMKISNGSYWTPMSSGAGSATAPNSSNIVSNVAALPEHANVGDVRYVYSPSGNTLLTYVYYNNGWIYSGTGSSVVVAANQIPNSLRFRSSGSAYLSRAPSMTGDAKTWTYSTWVKRGVIGFGVLAGYQNNAITDELIGFDTNGKIIFTGWNRSGNSPYAVSTSESFNDPSAWYHIVFVADTTKNNAADRQKIYVNGTPQVLTGSYVPQNYNFSIFSQGVVSGIGAQIQSGISTAFFDGYMAETIYVDGLALNAQSFGTQSSIANQWAPKQYAGSYGANGFHLTFENGTSTEALGYDSSINRNNWTTNNISLAAGPTYDWMIDTPTNNFAVLNPLNYFTPVGSTPNGNNSLAEGNLYLPFINGSYYSGFDSTISPSSGKWYFEATTVAGGSGGGGNIILKYLGATSAIVGASLGQNSYPVGSVFAFAFDCDAGTGTAYVNNSPVSTFSFSAGATISINGFVGNSPGLRFNFGQRPFAYAPPTGFKTLSTMNLATSTPTASGTFTGNLSSDGPFVWLGGAPEALWINGNPVSFGTQVDRTAGGFKVRNNTAVYNATGSNTWRATYLAPTNNSSFKYQNASYPPLPYSLKSPSFATNIVASYGGGPWGVAWLPNQPDNTASWLWNEPNAATLAAVNVPVTFQRVFNYGGSVNASAQIYASCDNTMDLYINNVLTTSGATFLQPAAVLLKPGDNILQFTCTNIGSAPNPAGFYMSMWMDGKLVLHSDAAWTWF